MNAFDQYVPGFGITFLLVDMLWGVGVGLIDERDWGTLARLRVSGAPASGMMLGKLMSRFLIGLGQMILLFGAGWALFGISLGRNSWALLLPAAAISFAAAAFSLVIACVANTRDAVLPIGAMAALAMSAIGGCWWPLDFEPYWMRAARAWDAHNVDDGGVQQPDDSRTRSVEYSVACGGYVCNRYGLSRYGNSQLLANLPSRGSMSRESYLLRGPLKHELLLFVAQLGRRMEEIVISGRHRAAVHDGCNLRGHRVALLYIQRRPVREIQDLSSFVRAEQIRRRKFRIPGAAAAVGMAIEARVRENFVDLRVCRETIRRSRSSLASLSSCCYSNIPRAVSRPKEKRRNRLQTDGGAKF